jgi:hypothetical protein
MKICLRPLQFYNILVQKVADLVEECFNIKPATHGTNWANWANWANNSINTSRPNFTSGTRIATLAR